MSRAARTKIGPAMLGRSSTHIVRQPDEPRSRAEVTYSEERAPRTSPRDSREYDGQETTITASTALRKLGAERGGNGQGQDDPGESENDVGDAHDDRVDEPGKEPGDGAEGRADHHRHRDQQRRQREREAGAVQDAAEHVATQLVGPEQVDVRRAPR